MLPRCDAKKILADPLWREANPVIQLNGNKFLDIRKLLLYKANHSRSDQKCCNALMAQTGQNTLSLVSVRTIRRGEEILWEYSATWCPS
jgi:hypothetical protein